MMIISMINDIHISVIIIIEIIIIINIMIIIIISSSSSSRCSSSSSSSSSIVVIIISSRTFRSTETMLAETMLSNLKRAGCTGMLVQVHGLHH